MATTLSGKELVLVTGLLSTGTPSGQSEQVTTAQIAALGSSTISAGMVLVSQFGLPTGIDDTATIQAAFNSAVLTNRRLYFDAPSGGATTWWVGSTIADISGQLSTPQVLSVNTTTGVFTFDRNLNLVTGNVIGFVGSNIGAGGGFTEVLAYTEYFINIQSGTTALIYDTHSHANSGGATGKYIPSIGTTTTATINALTSTTDIASTNTTVTVTDASKIINGDLLNLTNNATGTYYTVTNISANTITFTPAYTGATINAGATIWPTSVDVTSTLSLEDGATFSFSGPSTINSLFGTFVVTSIIGNTVHFQYPPTNSFPLPGATQTLVMGVYADPQFFQLKFELMGSPNVVIKKKSVFSGNAIFQFASATEIHVHDIEMWGLQYGPVYDPNILNGDDGVRFLSTAGARVERVRMKNFGDSALRFNTSSYWPGARSVSYPTAGVYCHDIILRDSFFYNCFQVSTTTSNDNYQGGAYNIILANNFFENIGASIKFANRAPGAANLYILGNNFKHVGRDCLELDSYDNITIDGNTFEDFFTSGITLIANNLQPIGFAFNKLSIRGNVFNAGAFTNAVSSTAAILLSLDLYPDATEWDYLGLDISGNRFFNMPASTQVINIIGGSFQNATINDNTVNGCYCHNIFNFAFRVSSTSGLDNSVIISGNNVGNCLGTYATFIAMIPPNGSAGNYINGVSIANNSFDCSNVSLTGAGNNGIFLNADYLQNCHITDNWWIGYGLGGIAIATAGNNVSIIDNDIRNLNAVAGSCIALTGVSGIRIVGNKLTNSYNGTSAVLLTRTCQNAYIFANDLSEAANPNYSINNIPIKSDPNCRFRQDSVSTTPTGGTWNIGDRYYFTAPASGSPLGAYATVAGSLSAITATGDSTSGSPILANISSMTNFSVGMYISHSGFAGTQTILSLGANSATLSTNATGNQTAQTISLVNPTFKNLANL